MEVSPSVLTYKGTFTEPSTEYLFLTNSSDQPLAFKVKTTAPKLYCVRPNASIVPPGESVKISLILQGFAQPLPKDYKCKDKFLIVSLPCPGLDDSSKVSESWLSLETKYKEQLLQKKLKVNFVIEDDDRDESQINDTTYANATQSPLLAAPAPVAAVSAVSSAASGVLSDVVSGIASGASVVGSTEKKLEIDSEKTNGSVAAEVPSVDKELEQSHERITTMSEKLDLNETVKQVSTSDEAVSPVSIPLAVVLVLIALLLSWYIF